METLKDLISRLKDNLYNASNKDYIYNNWISAEDIHKIRKGLQELNSDTTTVEGFGFLDKCYEFTSIYEYFFFDDYSDASSNVYEIINTIFDPVLIYLMDTDYEVNIRKVTISNSVETTYFELLTSLNAMEEAYHSLEFERVTSLSSAILQSLFKEICVLRGIEYNQNDRFPTLYNKIKGELKLDAKKYGDDFPKLREFSSHINSIVIKINELRNLYSESHGIEQQDKFHYNNLKKHHIKLIVDSTKTIVNFLVDSHEYQFSALSI